jgi:hypothetical protein
MSFPIEIFGRLNAQITALHGQNIEHAVLSFATSPTTRKTRSFVDFNENDCHFLPDWDISTFKRRNYCILRAEHSARRIKRRNKPDNSRNSIIRRFLRKMTIISFRIEIFRRLNAQITAIYAQNIVHAVLSVETSPTTRETRSFFDCNEKWP